MANRTITSKRKWAVDLSGRRGERGSDNLPAPPGFMSSVNQVHAEANRQGDPNLVIKKAWDIALSPLKSVRVICVRKDWGSKLPYEGNITSI